MVTRKYDYVQSEVIQYFKTKCETLNFSQESSMIITTKEVKITL